MQQHHEFLTTEPRDDIVLAAIPLEAHGELAQRGIARLMAEPVIHCLEVVDIHQQHRLGPGRKPRHLRLETGPGRSPGQTVVIDRMFQCLRQALGTQHLQPDVKGNRRRQHGRHHRTGYHCARKDIPGLQHGTQGQTAQHRQDRDDQREQRHIPFRSEAYMHDPSNLHHGQDGGGPLNKTLPAAG